jgi:hypothetical protein
MVYRRTLVYLFLLMIPTIALGQASVTASRSFALQVGGAVSIASPDYSNTDIKGFTIYADMDFTYILHGRLGIDAEIHEINLITPYDLGENSYLLGLRYKYRYGRLQPYLRVGGGIGTLNFNGGPGNYYATSSYIREGLYAIGGGLDVNATRKINIRVLDFEYQDWKDFPPNGLTPYVVSIGAAYNF